MRGTAAQFNAHSALRSIFMAIPDTSLLHDVLVRCMIDVLKGLGKLHAGGAGMVPEPKNLMMQAFDALPDSR